MVCSVYFVCLFVGACNLVLAVVLFTACFVGYWCGWWLWLLLGLWFDLIGLLDYCLTVLFVVAVRVLGF